MGKQRLSVALVGVGGYGQAHLQTLFALEGEGHFELTDVVEPYPERVPPASVERLREMKVRWHRSWEELEALGEFPNCVLLALPISLHAEYARRAYERGAWVYLEKPPVPLLKELEALVEMEGEAPRIQVGFQFFHSQQMRALREWLAEGRLGKITQYRLSACRPRSDAYYARAPWAGRLLCDGRVVLDGPVTNALAHGVQDIFAIEAAACGEISVPVEVSAELYRSRPMESYDVASLHGAFASGAKFAIALSHGAAQALPPVFEIEGTAGRVELFGDTKELRASFTTERVAAGEPNMVLSFREFFRCARKGERPRPGLAECRPFVAMTNAMLLASGGIHDIPGGMVQRIPTPEGLMRDVAGLGEFSRRAVAGNQTFSEAGAPWGRAGGTLALDASLISRMERYLQLKGSGL